MWCGLLNHLQLIFVFNNPSPTLSNWIGPIPSYHDLSTLMSRSWISFVHDLDPNNHKIAAVPYWPANNFGNPQNMMFRTADNEGGSFIEKDDFREEQLRWWDGHWGVLRS